MQRLERLQDVIKALNENGHNITSVNQMMVAIGMSRQAASSYATGKRGIGTDTVHKLAEHYGVNPSFVLYGHTPVLRLPQQFSEPAAAYQLSSPQYPYDQVLYKELQERINDLHRFITRLEKNLDDKEKIIKLLEEADR